MHKTTTLSSKQEASCAPKKAKKITVTSTDDFGPSEFTIQNILNYSKALQVVNLSNTDPVCGVMN